MTVDRIPAELRERPQWVVWQLEERDGKSTKVPYRADGQGRASSTDATTWTTFENACKAADWFDGVGYVFSPDDPYVGVDLDELNGDAGAIMLALNSYAERSVSGRGAHVIVKARLNGHPRNRSGPLEIYDQGRYFVMTGEHIAGTPETIEERQAELEQVLAHFMPAPEVHHGVRRLAAVPVDLDDQELLEKAMRAKNGAKFERLWNGNTSGYPSASEADLALCSLLAFWWGRDADAIDRMFRSSDLYREQKWERQDYRERTIGEAISRTRFAYSEPFPEEPTERTRSRKSVESEAEKADPQAETERNGLTDSDLTESVSPKSVPQREDETAGTDPDSESVTESGRPFAHPIREFIELEREQRDPMLADDDGRAVVAFLSLILCGAIGGHGKTTWFIDLALHLAAGLDYPPFTVPRPISILIIENEGPEQMFAEKLKARLEHFQHEMKERLDVCTFDWGGFSLADDTTRARLIAEIADKGYDLIFGDPLDSLGIEGVGSPDDTRKFLALMKEAGLNKTTAWWLNTHPRKEETKEALNEIAGAWGGKPDSVFLLTMLDDDRTRIRQPKLRWAKRGRGPTLLMAFDPDTEAFTFIGEEDEIERDYLAEIRTLLADGRWRIAKEIAAPSKKGGIAANVDTVNLVLKEHPDVFESRTGDAAKALNRKQNAVLWGLLQDDVEEAA